MVIGHRGRAPEVHPTCFVADTARVIGDVRLGARSSVWFGTVLRGDIQRIEVGEESNIQDLCVLHVTARQGVQIEDRVTVGHRAVVHGATVRSGALVGIGAIVLDGAEVGESSLVAAGAVVAPGLRIPPRSLVVGVPARVLRPLRQDELERLAEPGRNYLELIEIYRQEQGR
jgi:carbonic anhydrase/acetyltransferase-like protein (isoleucine patch superfamily)